MHLSAHRRTHTCKRNKTGRVGADWWAVTCKLLVGKCGCSSCHDGNGYTRGERELEPSMLGSSSGKEAGAQSRRQAKKVGSQSGCVWHGREKYRGVSHIRTQNPNMAHNTSSIVTSWQLPGSQGIK